MANPSVRKSVTAPRKAAPPGAIGHRACPECKADLRSHIPPEGFVVGEPVLCPMCAAVGMVDQAGKVRHCLTQEFLHVVWSIRYNTFWERRDEAVERLTAPSPS